MELPPIIKQADEKLVGWPDFTITLLLLLAAGIIIAIALTNNHILKAVILAWVVMP